MKEIRINHSEIERDFLDHVGLKENNRIFFTAPFGSGKSTFLQEIFYNNENYFTIKLFPVNYSVSANEDVFELIKFDLLIELLGNFKEEINLEKEDFSTLLLSQMFVLKELKLTPIIFAILKQCGKIGKSAVDVIKEVKKQYADFKSEMQDTEEIDIFSFLNLIQNQKGNEHEMDSVSTLIKNLVYRIKKNNKKQSVLIIDDLDRLDPDHTFRLFNIFSAHFKEIDNTNKFAFDKVIFVCDLENIKKIFQHKYGSDIDFAGYSDKFFSLVPYEFDNRRYIKEKAEDIYTAIEFGPYITWVKNEGKFFRIVLAMMNSLIQARLLNLRMLLQYPHLKLNEHYFGNKEIKNESILENPLVIAFYLLKNFYGSFTELKLKFKFLSEYLNESEFSSSTSLTRNDSKTNIKNLITFTLPFLLPEEKLSEDIGSGSRTYFLKRFDCTIHYEGIFNSSYLHKNFIKATVGNKEDSATIQLNPYKVLIDVFDTCQKLGAFK